MTEAKVNLNTMSLEFAAFYGNREAGGSDPAHAVVKRDKVNT